MKALSLRLGQFAVCAVLVTVLFRYVLSLCIGMGSWWASLLCSAAYFGLMYYAGHNFGEKDTVENEFHDIGFRFHLTTYIVCMGVGLGAHHLGWNTETLMSMGITAVCWGIGLLVHFILFLSEQKRTIKGYAKDEIFQ